MDAEHAATASLANLVATGLVGTDDARWALLGMLGASAIAKTIVAFTAGGARFGARVGLGLAAMVAAVATVLLVPMPNL